MDHDKFSNCDTEFHFRSAIANKSEFMDTHPVSQLVRVLKNSPTVPELSLWVFCSQSQIALNIVVLGANAVDLVGMVVGSTYFIRPGDLPIH